MPISLTWPLTLIMGKIPSLLVYSSIFQYISVYFILFYSVLFFVSDSLITGRSLSGLNTFPCLDTAPVQPAALAINPNGTVLYYISVVSASGVTLGQIEYNHSSCDADR